MSQNCQNLQHTTNKELADTYPYRKGSKPFKTMSYFSLIIKIAIPLLSSKKCGFFDHQTNSSMLTAFFNICVSAWLYSRLHYNLKGVFHLENQEDPSKSA